MFGYKKVLAMPKDEYDEFLKDYDKWVTEFDKIISNYDVISVILKLKIPKDAVVVTPDELYSLVAKLPIKHRCSKAMPVLARPILVTYYRSFLDYVVLFSRYDPHFTYEVGKMAIPDSFDADPSYECAHGIHFFETVEAAIDYLLL